MTARMKVSRRRGTKQMPTRRPMRGEKMMVVLSQLIRSNKLSSLNSLSVMYFDVLVFSKTTPFCASYSTSCPLGCVAASVPIALEMSVDDGQDATVDKSRRRSRRVGPDVKVTETC